MAGRNDSAAGGRLSSSSSPKRSSPSLLFGIVIFGFLVVYLLQDHQTSDDSSSFFSSFSLDGNNLHRPLPNKQGGGKQQQQEVVIPAEIHAALTAGDLQEDDEAARSELAAEMTVLHEKLPTGDENPTNTRRGKGEIDTVTQEAEMSTLAERRRFLASLEDADLLDFMMGKKAPPLKFLLKRNSSSRTALSKLMMIMTKSPSTRAGDGGKLHGTTYDVTQEEEEEGDRSTIQLDEVLTQILVRRGYKWLKRLVREEHPYQVLSFENQKSRIEGNLTFLLEALRPTEWRREEVNTWHLKKLLKEKEDDNHDRFRFKTIQEEKKDKQSAIDEGRQQLYTRTRSVTRRRRRICADLAHLRKTLVSSRHDIQELLPILEAYSEEAKLLLHQKMKRREDDDTTHYYHQIEAGSRGGRSTATFLARFPKYFSSSEISVQHPLATLHRIYNLGRCGEEKYSSSRRRDRSFSEGETKKKEEEEPLLLAEFEKGGWAGGSSSEEAAPSSPTTTTTSSFCGGSSQIVAGDDLLVGLRQAPRAVHSREMHPGNNSISGSDKDKQKEQQLGQSEHQKSSVRGGDASSSSSSFFKVPLLFIDTLHNGDQLLYELHKFQSQVSHWIILHDTTSFAWTDEEPDLRRVKHDPGVATVLAQEEKENSLLVPVSSGDRAPPEEKENNERKRRDLTDEADELGEGLRAVVSSFLAAHSRDWEEELSWTNNNGLTVLRRRRRRKEESGERVDANTAAADDWIGRVAAAETEERSPRRARQHGGEKLVGTGSGAVKRTYGQFLIDTLMLGRVEKVNTRAGASCMSALKIFNKAISPTVRAAFWEERQKKKTMTKIDDAHLGKEEGGRAQAQDSGDGDQEEKEEGFLSSLKLSPGEWEVLAPYLEELWDSLSSSSLLRRRGRSSGTQQEQHQHQQQFASLSEESPWKSLDLQLCSGLTVGPFFPALLMSPLLALSNNLHDTDDELLMSEKNQQQQYHPSSQSTEIPQLDHIGLLWSILRTTTSPSSTTPSGGMPPTVPKRRRRKLLLEEQKKKKTSHRIPAEGYLMVSSFLPVKKLIVVLTETSPSVSSSGSSNSSSSAVNIAKEILETHLLLLSVLSQAQARMEEIFDVELAIPDLKLRLLSVVQNSIISEFDQEEEAHNNNKNDDGEMVEQEKEEDDQARRSRQSRRKQAERVVERSVWSEIDRIVEKIFYHRPPSSVAEQERRGRQHSSRNGGASPRFHHATTVLTLPHRHLGNDKGGGVPSSSSKPLAALTNLRYLEKRLGLHQRRMMEKEEEQQQERRLPREELNDLFGLMGSSSDITSETTTGTFPDENDEKEQQQQHDRTPTEEGRVLATRRGGKKGIDLTSALEGIMDQFYSRTRRSEWWSWNERKLVEHHSSNSRGERRGPATIRQRRTTTRAGMMQKLASLPLLAKEEANDTKMTGDNISHHLLDDDGAPTTAALFTMNSFLDFLHVNYTNTTTPGSRSEGGGHNDRDGDNENERQEKEDMRRFPPQRIVIVGTSAGDHEAAVLFDSTLRSLVTGKDHKSDFYKIAVDLSVGPGFLVLDLVKQFHN